MESALKQFLASLNPVQREAVLHFGNPLLILAGAGSGKTRVIIGKIAYLIREQGLQPESILAVTFTNKAAGEMRTRASDLEPRAEAVLIKTFHSFGAWLLRRNTHLLDMSPQFTIYDDDDQLTLLSSLFPDANRNQLRGTARQISRAKDLGLRPDEDLSAASADPDFAETYKRYETRLREIGNADFGDLILRTTELLEKEQAVRQRIQERFRVVLVDEYQDSNIAQYRMLKALCGPQTYICVVGDDDQSIYRFRGAEVANILSFSEQFPGTDTIRLEQNYRSTGSILALAGAVVKNNKGRLGKELWTANPDGPLPSIAVFSDGEEEAAAISAYLSKLRSQGKSLDQTAILYRTNAQSRLFETSLLHAAIPYRIIGTLRFYEREEIKDAIAFLKFLANPKDEVSFVRIVNKPARGIGASSIQKILRHLDVAKGNIRLALEYALGDLSGKAKKSAGEFLELLGRVSTPPENTAQLSGWVERIIVDSRLLEYHAQQDEIAGTQKTQNLEELVNAAALYENSLDGLTDFLEAIELDSSRENTEDSDDAVTLITIHNTKGLEFDRIICTGMEEGLFPRNGDDEEEVEEERRLFYVAATRARRELLFSTCRARRLHGRFQDGVPSRFLLEIPEDLRVLGSDLGGSASFSRYGAPSRFSSNSYPRAGAWQGRNVDLASSRAMNPQSGRPAVEHEFQYPKGSRVYHDDYGSGEVIKSEFNGSEETILVRFETGRTATFLPKYSPLEKIDRHSS